MLAAGQSSLEHAQADPKGLGMGGEASEISFESTSRSDRTNSEKTYPYLENF